MRRAAWTALSRPCNMDSCTGKEATPEEPAEQEQPQNGMGGLLIFLVVGLLGGGAALYYVKFMKPKQNVKGSTDLDEFDFDEYDEDEPEEADSADTEQEDEENIRAKVIDQREEQPQHEQKRREPAFQREEQHQQTAGGCSVCSSPIIAIRSLSST